MAKEKLEDYMDLYYQFIEECLENGIREEIICSQTFFTFGIKENEATFKMADARVNQMTRSTASIKVGRGEAASRSNTPLTLENMQTTAAKKGMLYNKLRAVIGDSIVLSSQTYRNSEYTVFIRMGSMGGNQADAQDAVAVYGQWNGTNLYADLYTTGGGTGG